MGSLSYAKQERTGIDVRLFKDADSNGIYEDMYSLKTLQFKHIQLVHMIIIRIQFMLIMEFLEDLDQVLHILLKKTDFLLEIYLEVIQNLVERFQMILQL